ncbi:hypothetical protein COO03_04960 [Bacillus sp. AFS098217]|uniref:GNAT family N-acetyltransferase n=1 Tax=Bacillus sp. AFS098217 TaxID=2033868 RepID=UPI000BEC2CE1|nr:GNAT family N-acetyltransferase [Bacillus sp. AFS098217]PEB54593.1 hypothetical protein COO03_04960 [Bacillus sp. AFS098217]
MMDFYEVFGLEKTWSTKLQIRGDIKHEVQYMSQKLTKEGFKILSIIEKENEALILYRTLFEDTPIEEEDMISINLHIITKKGNLYPRPYLRALYTGENRKEIELADIYMQEPMRNLGYGSVLLRTLIDIAMNTGVECITGLIVSDNDEHWKGQVHFYQKHGCMINGNYLKWERTNN